MTHHKVAVCLLALLATDGVIVVLTGTWTDASGEHG